MPDSHRCQQSEDEMAIRQHSKRRLSLVEEEFDAENMNLLKVLMPNGSRTGIMVKTGSNGIIKMLLSLILF
jgi:hypothetical protein